MKEKKKDILWNYYDSNGIEFKISKMTDKELKRAIKFIRKKAKKGLQIFYDSKGKQNLKTLFGKELKKHLNYKGARKEFKKRIKQLT